MLKKTFVILLSFLFILSGCSKQKNASTETNENYCLICDVKLAEDYNYCPYCGNELGLGSDDFSQETELPDKNEESTVVYNDFGFINNYGLYEWITFDEYTFSDTDNPFISINKTYNFDTTLKYYVINLENNFYEKRQFKEYIDLLSKYQNPKFKGDRASGVLDSLAQYQIANNNLIKIPQDYDHDTVEINSVILKNNIPILSIFINEGIGSSRGENYSGKCIPTYFIDFTKKNNVIVEDGKVEIRYYINEQFLKDFS